MNNLYACILASALVFSGATFAQDFSGPRFEKISINDYNNWQWSELDEQVKKYVSNLTAEEKVAQLIMPAMGRLGQPEEKINRWVAEGKIGGILMLNGTKEQFTEWTERYNEQNKKSGRTAFFYSADAEPSLVNRKITGSTIVKKANELESLEDVSEVAQIISKDLNKIGINYNFAPVSDMASNGTVGYRGFGKDPKNIVPYSMEFVNQSTKQNILTSVKHFPGHGLVVGDTHKALQTIDGEMKELYIFKELIDNKVPSIMVGHIAVTNNAKYNTKGLPATVSPVIIQDLLRSEMGYKGLVVTDAMNMGGVIKVPNYSVKAIEAGVDIILMPLDTDKAYDEILTKYKQDISFAKKVDEATYRIIRMKICQGLIK